MTHGVPSSSTQRDAPPPLPLTSHRAPLAALRRPPCTQAKWFLRAARLAAESGKGFAAEDARHGGERQLVAGMSPGAGRAAAEGGLEGLALPPDPEYEGLAKGLRALEGAGMSARVCMCACVTARAGRFVCMCMGVCVRM